jgi:hypothetical protein
MMACVRINFLGIKEREEVSRLGGGMKKNQRRE